MQLLHSRCAGLDVHKKSVSVCARIQQGNKTIIETAVFGTFTRDLERLRDWLSAHKVQQVAMESTGVYWIPVFEILEQRGLEVMVVNARDAKHVPGRKTDVKDAQWLADFDARLDGYRDFARSGVGSGTGEEAE